VNGLKLKRLIWTLVFLGVTFTAIVMEVVAGVFHPAGTIPWTEYLAQYVPWPVQLAAYVTLAVWLPFHFWRADDKAKQAYRNGRADAVVETAMAKALQRPEAVDLVKYALHLRMHGERAPGGDETWGEFDRRAEEFLRNGG
jgi:hypothetical protein